jgi:hypothetical protein
MAAAAAGMGRGDSFGPAGQDRLALGLLLGGKRPRLRDYLMGKDVPQDQAQLELASEWASIPMANGKGRYDGDSAGNRATAKVEAVKAALAQARAGLKLQGGPKLATAAQQPARDVSYLRLVRTSGKPDARGLELLWLDRVKNGIVLSSLWAVSGAPGHQFFRASKDSISGSMEPLPEGRYRLGGLDWANGEGNYSASFAPGLGAVWVGLEYEAPGGTDRTAIGIHLDQNAKISPGTAGCVGLLTPADEKTFVGWIKADNPRHLFVDWGLGTCPKPIA